MGDYIYDHKTQRVVSQSTGEVRMEAKRYTKAYIAEAFAGVLNMATNTYAEKMALEAQLAAVTAERNELKSQLDAVPEHEIGVLITALWILSDGGMRSEPDPTLRKAMDWIEAREQVTRVTEVT